MRSRTPIAAGLAVVGGFVDGVGFLTLYGMFISHMSGNTTLTGVQLGQLHWSDAFHAAYPLPWFIIGVALGAAIAEGMTRRGWHATLAGVLGVEALLLALFMVWGSTALARSSLRSEAPIEYFTLAALPALAMGMQNAALRRVGGAATRTTFITGTLTSMAEELVTLLFWLGDRMAGHSWRRRCLALRLVVRRDAWQRMILMFAVWCGYLAGAVSGAAAEQHWGVHSLLLPLCGLAALVVLDLRRPLGEPKP